MIKKLLTFIILCFMGQVFAGEFENAVKSNKFVFLYLYSPDCGYCQKFQPVYNKLAKENKDFSFVKVNTYNIDGYKLMRKFKGRYVPYIILYNSEQQNAAQVSPACYMNEVCMTRALKEFTKK